MVILRCLPVEHFVGAQHAKRCGCFRLFARPVLLTLAIVLSIAAIMPAFSSRCRRPLRSADARMSKDNSQLAKNTSFMSMKKMATLQNLMLC